MSSLLRATGLRKTYRLGARSVEVLRGVDLAVEAGEFIALRGASGAGKSTLLHLLGGLDRPNHGDIQFRTQSLAALTDGELAKLRIASIGHVFQAYHLLPELDALENVCLPARVARLDAAQAERRARELLRRVGLEQRLEHRPAELSGGEQQRVAIARALVNQPQLILSDEPTGNLDSHTGEEILNLLCELRTEHNATLVIATHDSRVAARAPRVVELLDGALK
jgi:ABC-type lipoprotein export system ATPase subunit